MKIAFINNGKSYLPELTAYTNYFNKQKDFHAIEVTPDQIETIKACDIVWKFMGMSWKNEFQDKYHIHEYSSLSVGKFSKQKDLFKRHLNSRPAARIFLNDNIAQQMSFKDGIPYLNRDMGISNTFFSTRSKKEFDFVYVGDISNSRGLGTLLNYFKNINKDQNIVLIGALENKLYEEYKDVKNIIFTGKLNYQEVPLIASKAIYGINYMPNIFPFNIQTSTKLLEYCALGLKVITTDYQWVNQFENDRDARFLRIDENLTNFTSERIEQFHYKTPPVKDLQWETIFKNIQLIDFLKVSLQSLTIK